MSDICECSFSKITRKELLLLDPSELVSIAIKMIPVFLKNGKYKQIIEVAALLPSLDEMEKILDDSEKEFNKGTERSFENLRDTLDSIRIALSQMVKKEPYRLTEDNMKELAVVIDRYSVKGREHWVKELFKTFSDEKKLGGQISLWTTYFPEIKKLIEIFGFSKEDIREVLRKVLKKNEKLNKAGFWINYSSEVIDIIETFDLSKEAREMFEGIVEENEKNDPDACIKIAMEMNIPIDYQEFQKIADGFFKKSNEADGCLLRISYVSAACRTYEILKEKYQLSDSGEILLRMCYNDNYVGTQERAINKIIFRASKIIKGEESFKYKKQGPWDIHI